MRANLRRILSVCGLAFPLGCLAVDSTQSPFMTGTTATQTPPVIRAQPYVLEQGYLDISGSSVSNAYWLYGTALCATTIANSAGTLTCQTYFMTTKGCPTTDSPYIEVYPMKPQITQGETGGICIGAIVNYGPTAGMFVYLNGGMSYGTSYPYNYGAYGTLNVSMVGFTAYCYPPGITPPPYEGTYCGPAPSSYSAGTPILWDTGYVSWPTNTGSEQHFLTTNRICPYGYQPYATIVSTKTWVNGGNYFILGGGVCVNGMANSGGNYYSVAYLAVSNYTAQGVSNFSNLYQGNTYTLREYGNVNAGIGPGNYNFVSSISDTYGTGINDKGGLQWTVYCYPPGVSPPGYSPNCAIGQAPF